ncbi:MAG TPA: alanyl-tRNA editing protein [Bryobacteraceae bacterium]|nr:alanyl-tRNA editing protein [Bryobacteraceae bacterium]
MTERLYYNDSRLLEFEARVIERSEDGLRVWLDRTAFYPTSGGQPFDTGTLAGVAVVDVIDEDDRIVHVLEQPIRGDTVTGRIDRVRRFDHMQQHTGQHLLSAVFVEMLNAPTVSFHLGADSSTIDLGIAALSPEQVRAVEHRCNEIVQENRPVTISFEHVSEARDLRKASEREGEIRIIAIAALDRSACGGTHVRSTGEIGPMLMRRLEKIRGNIRVEFLCGFRALDRARRDYEALAAAARAFSAPLDEVPERVASQISALQEAEKARVKLAAAVARDEGRRLYGDSGPFVSREVAVIDDEARALAQGFTAGPNARFMVTAASPPSILLAVSADSGLHAGNELKAILTQFGGRGGGNATIAQGSLPDAEALKSAAAALSERVGR